MRYFGSKVKKGGDAVRKNKTTIIVAITTTIIVSLIIICCCQDTIQVNVKLNIPKTITVDIKKVLIKFPLN